MRSAQSDWRETADKKSRAISSQTHIPLWPAGHGYGYHLASMRPNGGGESQDGEPFQVVLQVEWLAFHRRQVNNLPCTVRRRLVRQGGTSWCWCNGPHSQSSHLQKIPARQAFI